MQHPPHPVGGPEYGAFVISLDLELHWGVRDVQAPESPYRANLLGEREAIPALLECFRAHEIRATWATVGFLFAGNRGEVERFSPTKRPSYLKGQLSAYNEPLGPDEADDPLHYGRSLVDAIAATPGQEVGTHTFSHFYCLEAGQTPDEFRADLESAIAIAAHRGLEIRSIVFPRNQTSPEYIAVAREVGLSSYRGNQSGPAYEAVGEDGESNLRRARRLLGSYTGRPERYLVGWDEIHEASGMANVAASAFLRPYSPTLRALESRRLRQITSALEHAATSHRIFHLWWHPHNFGVNLDENMAFLHKVIDHFSMLRDRYGMRSMTMNDVAEIASLRKA